MSEISDVDAQNRLSVLLDEVENGQEVTITRDGRPVAKLVRVIRESSSHPLVDEARSLREQIAARGERFTVEEIKSFIEEGRR